MKNLLFFLWMMFYPIIDDVATWIIWKTKAKPQPEDYYEGKAMWWQFIFYVIIGALLYER